MLRGEKYTISSDLWSLGILLYAMVAGELPFTDENQQRLMQKIVFTEPRYPAGLSHQLKSLLTGLLMKNPSERIQLNKIKEHPWFSNYEYSKMMNKNFGVSLNWRVIRASSKDNLVDRDILQQMTKLGFNCTQLPSFLLKNERNYTTAVYRMLRKDKVTDLMGEFMQNTMVRQKPKKNLPPPLDLKGRVENLSISARPRAGNRKHNDNDFHKSYNIDDSPAASRDSVKLTVHHHHKNIQRRYSGHDDDEEPAPENISRQKRSASLRISEDAVKF